MQPTFYTTTFLNNISKFTGLTPIFRQKPITGIAQGFFVAGIDIRPSNNLLYALATNRSGEGILYTIDAEASPNAIASNGIPLTGTPTPILNNNLAIDFNPVADRLRVIDTVGQNLSVDPDTGNTATQTSINGAAQSVYGCAYTNSTNPPPMTTTLYDLGDGQLYIQNPPASGTTTLVGPLNYQTPAVYVELDILTIGNQNFAYGLSDESNPNVNNLYSIDLNSPSATLIGPIDTLDSSISISGFAVISANVPCLHPETQVLTAKGKVSIDNLKAGSQVYDYKGESVRLVNNIRFQPSTTFYNIKANALAFKMPEKDLLIRENHPILYKGKEIDAKALQKELGKAKVKKVKLNESVYVWSLCTEERTFVMMENVPVATWSNSDLLNMNKYNYTRF